MLNYLYRLAEIECVLACHATGLDPSLGFLHLDKPSRDSLALDLLEVVRPEIESYVLDRLQIGEFPRTYFHETRDGTCRLVAPLTHELAEQSPTWARILAPVAEEYARTLASAGNGYIRVGKPTQDKTLMRTRNSQRIPLKGVVTVERLIPDDMWSRVQGLLPSAVRTGPGRSPIPYRSVLAGIVCVKVLGTSWAQIPRTLGVSRFTCKARLDEWQNSGRWDAVWNELRHLKIR